MPKAGPPDEQPLPDKLVSKTIFGWCSTEHHTSCIIQFTGHECLCACHAKNEEFLGDGSE